jgi:D-beta-D-heptose 7-phosphate kinase/D-beta-D-heptose 1-phosphate adenosyltransferase
VLAVLGLCQAAGVPLIESLQLANAAAGLEVERFGVESITRNEISRELAHGKSMTSGPLSLDELVRLVNIHRRVGRSIVLTNGCFDLLHVGHISLLEEAAKLGDVLIVAINSDASVRELKGRERPIIGENDRARMLSALASVDHVLVFDDDTPHRLLQSIKPDVLVKGGTTGYIIGREIVEAYGGQVVRTAAIPGSSTTAITQRMRVFDGIESGP